ncbi:AP-4 complex subunit mu-1-like [Amphiura filiformis]|uniref:AP-4 complex subunit mu-1-like n=1 Tax=Amphiura filiformis TaxID=82378 RepID=UPI003B20C481
MLAQLFILSSRGDVLIFKDYRGDGPKDAGELFVEKLKSSKGQDLPPVIEANGIYMLHIKCANLFFVCTTKSDVSPFTHLELLARFSNIVKDYCGILTEESIQLNFALINELVDEIIDYGYVQTTSTKALKPYVQGDPTQVRSDRPMLGILGLGPGLFGSDMDVAPGAAAEKPIPMAPSGQLFRGAKNEIYLDVIEKLTVLISANGSVIRGEVNGCINLKSFVIGNPELQIGLSDDLVIGKTSQVGYGSSVRLDHANFHPSVNLTEFDQKRTVIIHPSEGQVTFMKYGVSGELPSALPFQLSATIEEVADKQALDIQFHLRCDLPKSRSAVNVAISIPVPKATTDVIPSIQGSGQSIEYKASERQTIWAIKKIAGGTDTTARLRLTLNNLTTSSRLEVGPANLDFEIKDFVCSHLQIKYLKVFDRHNSYVPYRWVRYVSLSDSYVVRLR